MKQKEGGAQTWGSVGRVAQDLRLDSGFLPSKLSWAKGPQPPSPWGSNRPRAVSP